MDLRDRAAYKFEGGFGALYYQLSDFARVAAPYLHSAYVKGHNTKREKYVLSSMFRMCDMGVGLLLFIGYIN